jgi:putative hydrolase of the HAD superfamily
VLEFDEERREKLSKKAIQEYRDKWIEQTDFFPETLEVLDALKHDHKLGVVTNYSCGPTARKVFRKLNFDKYFDAIVVSAEVGYRKPNRMLFEIALKELNSTPEKAVMIGDTFGADIVGARNMGIRNILIDSNGRQRDHHHLTDVVVKNIGEVLKVMGKKRNFKPF